MAENSGAMDTDYSDFSAGVDDFRHFKLMVHNRTFFVHASILADLSPYFCQMFFDKDMQEKTDGQAAVIEDETPEDILELLRCLVQSSPTRLKPKPINATNFGLLIRLAKKFEIASLVGRCQHYILNKFQSEEVDDEAQLLDVLKTVDRFALSGECRAAALERAKRVSDAVLRNYDFGDWNGNFVAELLMKKMELGSSSSSDSTSEAASEVVKSLNAKLNTGADLAAICGDDYSDFALATPFARHRLNVEGTTLYINGPQLASLFFGGDFKEKTDREATIKEETLADLLEMLRCALMNSTKLKKVKQITASNCALLIQMADKFQFPSLMAACERFMRTWPKGRDITEDQAADILTCATVHHLSQLTVRTFADQILSGTTFPSLVRLATELQSDVLKRACEQFLTTTCPSMTADDRTALARLATAAVHQLSSAIDRCADIGEDDLLLAGIFSGSWPSAVVSQLWRAKVERKAQLVETYDRMHCFATDGTGSLSMKGYVHGCVTAGCLFNGNGGRSVAQCTVCERRFCSDCLARVAGSCPGP